MLTQALRAQLERLFDLPTLSHLSQRFLALEPGALNAHDDGESLARALVLHCERHAALPALCDAAIALKPETVTELGPLRERLFAADDALPPGSEFGPFVIQEHLGGGPNGHCYRALQGDRSLRLKLLHRHRMGNREGVQRVLTCQRLLAAAPQLGLTEPVRAVLPSGGLAGVLEGRAYLACDFVPGQTLGEVLRDEGPLTPERVRGLLEQLLQVLSALHERGLVAACISVDNVLVSGEAAQERINLLDVGGGLLRGVVSSASDLRATGALMYELLCGLAPEQVLAARTHLPAPSSVGQAVAVGEPVDQFVLALIAGGASGGAEQLRETLLGLQLSRGGPRIEQDDLAARSAALLEDPLSEVARDHLEDALRLGADRVAVADALLTAAARAHATGGQPVPTAELYQRAAELLATTDQLSRAHEALLTAFELAPVSARAAQLFERICRAQGKHEELVEWLLGHAETQSERSAKARSYEKIGALYERDLHDDEQALVAYTHALCEDPQEPRHAANVQRVAGQNPQRWTEVLSSCAEATMTLEPQPNKALSLLAGGWYSRLHQSEAAIACYRAVLALDAAEPQAFTALEKIYRDGQHWSELRSLLLDWAEHCPNRDRELTLRLQAAELAEQRLDDAPSAEREYAQILERDPGYTRAFDALLHAYENRKVFESVVALLHKRAQHCSGNEAVQLYCRAAEISSQQLQDAPRAQELFDAALSVNPDSVLALRGLEVIFVAHKQIAELLQNLARQLELADTPRQRVELLLRLAQLHERELLQQDRAIETLKQLLQLEPTHAGAHDDLLRLLQEQRRWQQAVDLLAQQADGQSDVQRKKSLLLQQAQLLQRELGDVPRAIEAYEQALALAPADAEILSVLAQLRESTGDARAALQAVLAMAEDSSDPKQKLGHLLRAAELCGTAGDLDAAVEHYRRCLDLDPHSTLALRGLRSVQLQRGDAAAALTLLERELAATEGKTRKAQLLFEAAGLLHGNLDDGAAASDALTRALDLDPTLTPATLLAGDIAFAAGRYREAHAHYQKARAQLQTLPATETRRVLLRMLQSLEHVGNAEAGLELIDPLLSAAADDAEALSAAGRIAFEYATPERACELCGRLLARHGNELDAAGRASWTWRLGESQRRAGQLQAALATLEEAADLAPGERAPLVSLALAHTSAEDWPAVLKVKERTLDLTQGSERADLLTEIGELAADKLQNPTRAVKSFVAALEVRPQDRKLLTRLMALYGESREWLQLLGVVEQLAQLAGNQEQQTKYLMTAAMLCERELDDPERALGFYARVLNLDSGNSKALQASLTISEKLERFDEVERLLQLALEGAQQRQSSDDLLRIFLQLGALYRDRLQRPDAAIDAFEAASTLDPNSEVCEPALRVLYAQDLERYRDRAIQLQIAQVHDNPFRAEPYKELRRLYTELRRADPSWCMCEVLNVLGLSAPDEDQFFERLRSEEAAALGRPLSEGEWQALLHPDVEPLLGVIFAALEPIVVQARAQPLADLGYLPELALDTQQLDDPAVHAVAYVAGALGAIPPLVFHDAGLDQLVVTLPSREPALVLGARATAESTSSQSLVFALTRALLELQPGFRLRRLLSSGTAFKAWLLAAIRLNVPSFPLPPELLGPVEEASRALLALANGAQREELTRRVAHLLQESSELDIKRWAAGVDFTADRIGFVLAHDLRTATSAVESAVSDEFTPARELRLRELVFFAVSESYFQLRSGLHIGIDN